MKKPNIADDYNHNGFTIVEIFTKEQCRILEDFAKNWVYDLLEPRIKDIDRREIPLEQYHIWSIKLNIDHPNTFRAKNRFKYPGAEVEETIVNSRTKDFFNQIGMKKFEIWKNEGLGTLGFRFIRPGAGDGYTLSSKQWGPAKKVVSCWIPIIGHSPNETLTLVPGSHLVEHDKYIPENIKFTPDEYRFKGDQSKLDFYNPSLKKGEVIFFHPKILHTEEIIGGGITRLSLEMRFNPLNK